MAKKQHDTPMLDELESGPWPSFVTGLKRLANDKDYMVDLMGQLETSYRTKKGYWKGGTVGVFGYGGGVIPRFTELKNEDNTPVFPDAAEFHTLRIQPPAGMHYNTDVLRKMCDIWEEHGSGLIAFHGQSGDIMFQGAKTDKVQDAFDALNELGFDLGGAGPAVRTSMSCVGAAEVEAQFIQRIEGVLHLVGLGPLEHDVATLAVECDQARAVLLPDVAHLAQHGGVVVQPGWRLHAKRVELGCVGELWLAVFVLQFGEPGNDTTAVAADADGAALPVALAGPIGRFQLTHQVDHGVLVVGKALEARDEARPLSAFELVEQRRRVLFLRHWTISWSGCRPGQIFSARGGLWQVDGTISHRRPKSWRRPSLSLGSRR